MKLHRGEIVDKALRKSGFSITRLAKALKISRNTLYNKLKNPDLDYEFIVKVGDIIHYNFKFDFPEIKSESPMEEIHIPRGAAELLDLKNKYIQLTEQYEKLCELLTEMANANDLQMLKREIGEFLEMNKKQPDDDDA